MRTPEQLPHTGWCGLSPDHAGRCHPSPEARARTAAATEANVRRRLAKNVAELRERGYLVISPEALRGVTDADRYTLREIVSRGADADASDAPEAGSDYSPARNVPASGVTRVDFSRELDAIDAAIREMKEGRP